MSASSHSAFRAATVRSVWGSEMPLANTLNLLEGPVEMDPASEVSRIYRMLDLVAHGVAGHGPVHLLLVSDAEIVFAWDREQQGIGS